MFACTSAATAVQSATYMSLLFPLALGKWNCTCRYDLGLIGGALLSIRDEFTISEPAVELVVAAAKIGAFFGTFFGGGLMVYYGRRTTIALDSVFFMLGPVTMASASGMW